MHIVTERGPLLRTLDHLRGVVEKRNTIPVLSNVLIAASGGKVTMTATDLDLEVTETFEAGVLKGGATTVPAHLFHEIVRKLPEGGQVSIELGETGAVVKCGRSRFVLATLPREDFPTMEAGGMQTKFTIAASALANMIAKVKTSMSTEETRYYLNGFFLEAKNDRLRAVSTDGHRLTRFETDLPDGAAGMKGIIVPRRAAGEIQRLLSDTEADVEFSASESKIMLVVGGITIKSKLVDGTYPPYERVIPTGNANTLEADVAELASTIERVCVVHSSRTSPVKLTMDGMTMTIYARDSQSSAEAVDDLPVEYSGQKLEIGFNHRYLNDILAQVKTGSVRFLFGDAGSPAIIEPLGESGTLYLLMPVRF